MKISNIQNPAFKGKICFKAPDIAIKENYNYINEDEASRKGIFDFKNTGDGYSVIVDTKDIKKINPNSILVTDKHGHFALISYRANETSMKESMDVAKQIYAMQAYNCAKDSNDMLVSVDFTI